MNNTPPATDPWIRADATVADGDLPAGRVLRVKLGYNPNSSSVGSVVSMLAWSASVAAIALNIIAATVAREAARPDARNQDENG
jgi:hypothetical protein